MIYLAQTLVAFIFGVTVTAIIARAFRDKTIYFVPQATPNILSNAQYAANQSRKDQLVIFTGERFRIVCADNQYAVDGHVVYVAHPEVI